MDFELCTLQQEELLFKTHLAQLNQELKSLKVSFENDDDSTLAYDWMEVDSNDGCEVDDELSFASNDSTLVDSPRRCTKTKSHVQGAIIPDGLLDAGEICTFSTLKQVKCDLCLKRNRLVHNPVTNKQAKEKADVARENGMCPGVMDHGCKDKNPAVFPRVYCEECQELVKKNCPKTQESHRKQAERATGIKVTIPFSTQMAALGACNIQSLLPASSLKKLSVSNTVGVDTANAIRSVEAKHMYIVGAYYVDSNGSHMAFWASRIGNDEEWLSATWNIRINNIPVPGGDIFVMLDSFASFAAGRQIVFSTGNNACDYKRLTSAYKWKPEIYNPFPPEKEWFNVGKELVSHVIGWNGVIKSPNWKLPTIHSNLYQTRTDAGTVIKSVPYPLNYISIQRKVPDTIRDAIWALNVLNCFKNHLQ